MKGQLLLFPLFLSLGIHGLLAIFLLPSSPKETSGNPLAIEVVWARKENPSLPQDCEKTEKKKIATVNKAKQSSPHKNKKGPMDCLRTTKEEGRTDELPPTAGAQPLQKGTRQAYYPLPAYPWICRKRNQEGVVTLIVTTSEEGRVMQVTLQKSSGYERLDKAALQALRSWVFTEGKLQKIIQIAFRLDQDVRETRERMTRVRKT